MDTGAIASANIDAGRELRRRLIAFSRVAALVCLSFGAIVLAGWAFDLNALKSLRPALGTMKANTALSFLASGTSLLLWHFGSATPPPAHAPVIRSTARALAVVTLMLGLLTVSQDFFSRTAGIDELLFADTASGALPPGRMSPATALCFVALGAALILLASSTETAIRATQGIAAVVIAVAAAALLGYFLNVEALFKVRGFHSMAAHTAAALFLLGTGLLLARPADGWIRELTADTSSAKMGRRLLISIFVVLPILGWLRLEGQRREWYGTEFGIAILVAASILIMAALIWWSTRGANRSEARIVYLSRVYSLLSGINALIVRVQSRDDLFKQSCRIAVEGGLFQFAWLGTVNREAGRIQPVAWSGDDRGFVAKLAGRHNALKDDASNPSPVMRAVMTGKPIVSNNVAADTTLQLRSALVERGIRSAAILPIVLNGETIAVFALHSDVPHFFNDEEMTVLVEMAGDMAFALDHIEKERTLRYLANFDPLTGLANETRLRDRLRTYLKGYARQKTRLALVIFDIERFKMVNDSFGRKVGDELLQQVARRLEAWSGAGRVARIGSNQFAAMMTRIAHDNDIAHMYERAISECFSKPFVVDGEELRISARAGIAVFPQDGVDENVLLSNAEDALKQSRGIGERCVFYNPQINASVAERLRLESRLRDAVQHNRFVLHYQPKFDVRTRELKGVEALIRWYDTEIGLVPPLKLIPLLEETGLIREVGRWVIRQAVADLSRFAKHGVSPGGVAVNVSSLQLRQDDFVQGVSDALGEQKLASSLELEITESVLMRDIDKNLAKLSSLKKLGVRVSIDDFGTGYSSMAYLAKLPVDCLKIDRMFIAGLQEDKVAMTLVSTMISLAHSLGLEVVAEGVETEGQANILRLLNCDQMQGFLLCKPLPFAEALKFLEEHNSAVQSVA